MILTGRVVRIVVMRRKLRVSDVVDAFLKEHPDFTWEEAYRMNFCVGCGAEHTEETKSSIWGCLEVIRGENGERIVPSITFSSCMTRTH